MRFAFFYKLSKSDVGPIIPVFKDDSRHFIQSSTHGIKVDSFEEVPDCHYTRKLFNNERNITAPKRGDDVLYAYQYAKDSILMGNLSLLKDRISEIVNSQNYPQTGSFAKLEMALFVGDMDAVRIFSLNCYQTLLRSSPRISLGWLEGCQVPEEVKTWVKLQAQQNTNGPDKGARSIRISCPRIVIDTIDKIAKETSTTRSNLIDFSIESLNIETDFEIDDFKKFYSLYNREVINKTERESPFDYFEFKIAAKHLRVSDEELDAAQFFLLHDWRSFARWRTSKPNIVISRDSEKRLRTVLRNAVTGTSDRAKGAFVVYCLAVKDGKFYNLIQKAIEESTLKPYPDKNLHVRYNNFKVKNPTIFDIQREL